MYTILYAHTHILHAGNSEIIFNRHKLRSGSGNSRSDICDGVVYQKLVKNGFLANKHNISVVFNTDGVPVFRSSAFSFWPLYLVVNELPYRMRYTFYKISMVEKKWELNLCFCFRVAKENRLFAGLWYGSTKPDMTLFLKPFAHSLAKLYSDGMLQLLIVHVLPCDIYLFSNTHLLQVLRCLLQTQAHSSVM